MQPFTAADGITYYRYDDYLRSELWQSIKDNYYKRRPAICAICRDASKPVDLHHLTYENIGRESVNDLIPLCKQHHKLEHKYRPYATALKAEKQAKKKNKFADKVAAGLKRYHRDAKRLLELLVQIYPALIRSNAEKPRQRKPLEPKRPTGTIVVRKRAATSPAAQ